MTTTSITKMVALGSSFAAGPGIRPVADRFAFRSTRNYAHLVSNALEAKLTDATVSGATTSTILDVPQRMLWRRFAPQIEAVTPDTDLVTVTAGGNDLNYVGDIGQAATANWLLARRATHRFGMTMRSKQVLLPRTAQQIEETANGLQRIVEESRRRAPKARVVLVDYLPLLDSSSMPGGELLLRRSEIRHVREVASALSHAFALASERSGADLVPASRYEPGHTVGTAQPYTRGLALAHGSGFIFHPTVAGMEAAAAEILKVVADPIAVAGEKRPHPK